MAYKKTYENRSSTEKGYSEKISKMKRDAYDPQVSKTGYGQPILGMDDIDRIRRNKLKD